MESYGATETRIDDSPSLDALKSNDDNLLNNQNGVNGTGRPRESNGGYPKSVFFILGTEFCERFSYYGMRAILILYLTKWLKFDADNATGVYHGFVFLCYFSPLFGAIIADGYLGRYRTILYLSIIYGIGNVIMSATAVPPPEWIGPMIALILIGIGTGGIKPCVAAFGADQFRPEQEKERETFFSVFYFMINLGSMFSIILTPILRADVHCFGEECYPLAFGIPAILMISSAVIFIAGGRLYKKIPPTGNLIGRVFKCIFYGLKGKISNPDKRPHWLDHSIGLFEADFVKEVKRLLKVLIICVPLPLYWALGDQQGSRWTLQAEQLDGSMGPLGRIKPDQLQALNPILILVLIPLFEKLIYPCLDKCQVPNRPLQRMVAGMFLSVIAFIMAGFVQLKINNQFESPLTSTEIGITHYNVLPCTASFSSSRYSQSIRSLQIGKFQIFKPGNITWNVSADCSTGNISQTFNFIGSHSYRLVVLQNNTLSLDLIKIEDQRKKSREGNALISVMNMDNSIGSVKLVPTTYTGTVSEKTGITFDIKNHTHLSLEPESYKVYKLPKNGDNETDWSLVSSVKLGIGGIYTLLLYNENSKTNLMLFTSVEQNSLSMFVMVPQYIVITVGEILFSITGLSFGYSQAPKSMKSFIQAVFLMNQAFGNLIVAIISEIQLFSNQAPKSMKSFIQAAFLMNTAFGNLIVAIISEIRLFSNQAVEFFFYAVIMLVDIIIFMVIAYFYEYVRVTEEATIHADDTSGLIDNLEMEDSYKNK